MFALFFSLYYAMFTGSWTNYNYVQITSRMNEVFDGLGQFITSIFGDNTMNDLGQFLSAIDGTYQIPSWIALVSFILALITSIGIVVLAVKGIKRIFAVFFTFGR